jgi:hypothetical protein
MVERATTLAGLLARIADFTAAIADLASGNLGEGAKYGGRRIKTACAPVKALLSASASFISAMASSQPCRFQAAALPLSRTTPRTDLPADSKVRATAEPTWPVMPVSAKIDES